MSVICSSFCGRNIHLRSPPGWDVAANAEFPRCCTKVFQLVRQRLDAYYRLAVFEVVPTNNETSPFTMRDINEKFLKQMKVSD